MTGTGLEGSHLVPLPHVWMPHRTGCPSLAPLPPQRSVLLSQKKVATPRDLRNLGTGLENEDQSKNAVLNLARLGLLCHLASGPHFPQLSFQHWCLCRSLFHYPSHLWALGRVSNTLDTPNILSCVTNGKIKKPLLEDFTSVLFPQILVM